MILDVCDLIQSKRDPESLSLKERASVVSSETAYGPDETPFIGSNAYLKDNGYTVQLLYNVRSFGKKLEWRRTKKGTPYQQFTEDKTVMQDDFCSTIPFCQCRHCHKENTVPYTENFFEKCDGYETLYCFENGYCKECAELLSSANHYQSEPVEKQLKIVRETSYDVGGDPFKFIFTENGEVFATKIEPNKRR